MKDIKLLANQFRAAIDMTRDAGEFDKDFSFYKFPRGCCGDASDLLAQFLLENDIKQVTSVVHIVMVRLMVSGHMHGC